MVAGVLGPVSLPTLPAPVWCFCGRCNKSCTNICKVCLDQHSVMDMLMWLQEFWNHCVCVYCQHLSGASVVVLHHSSNPTGEQRGCCWSSGPWQNLRADQGKLQTLAEPILFQHSMPNSPLMSSIGYLNSKWLSSTSSH